MIKSVLRDFSSQSLRRVCLPAESMCATVAICAAWRASPHMHEGSSVFVVFHFLAWLLLFSLAVACCAAWRATHPRGGVISPSVYLLEPRQLADVLLDERKGFAAGRM